MNGLRHYNVHELPLPPDKRLGWPWTKETLPAFERMPDGAPWPTVSVVTPSLNQGQFLEETIRSVLLQGYPNLEYYVIDGGSTDTSLEIIKRYAPWLSGWVSEPDRGQPHAINKGLRRCTGEFFNYVNSDDVFQPGCIQTVVQAFGDNDMVAGACEYFDANGIVKCGANSRLSAAGLLTSAAAFHQPAIWYRRDGVHRCGGYCESLHFAFDYDLTVRYLARFPKVWYPDSFLARFRLHPDSKTVSTPEMFVEDRKEILRRILLLPEMQELRPLASRLIKAQDWGDLLASIRSNSGQSPLQRAGRIFIGATRDPHRWTRFTLGAIRHLLLPPAE